MRKAGVLFSSVETRDFGLPIKQSLVRRRQGGTVYLGGRRDKPVGGVAVQFGERSRPNTDSAIHRQFANSCRQQVAMPCAHFHVKREPVFLRVNLSFQ